MYGTIEVYEILIRLLSMQNTPSPIKTIAHIIKIKMTEGVVLEEEKVKDEDKQQNKKPGVTLFDEVIRASWLQ